MAAESFPSQMPAFIRSPTAIREISYLGPEPDRWRPEIAPELSTASSPDHVFRLELGEQLPAHSRVDAMTSCAIWNNCMRSTRRL